jgi:putative transposase
VPRQARLDAPGTLHHVMVRGIERRRIVDDELDRRKFVARVGQLALATGTKVYAWALLSNHAHLLLASGPRGLAQFMRRLLTGYAVHYNIRHRRYGHLFQNRYKSIVCDADSYFTELVRYIHLNPLRVKLVKDMRELERYPYCGHGAITGKVSYEWQDRDYVLNWFGKKEREAVRAYREFVREGVSVGRRPELAFRGQVLNIDILSAVMLASRSWRDPCVLNTPDLFITLPPAEMREDQSSRITEIDCCSWTPSRKSLTATTGFATLTV